MKICRKRMLELLVIKKMSQAELARILGTTPSFVAHVLNGRKKLSFKKSKLLIELFGADLMSRVIDWEGIGINDGNEIRIEVG